MEPDGGVYVVDTHNHRIQKFSSEGVFVTKWGTKGSGDGQFINPYDVAVGPNGDIYVADPENNRIQKFLAEQ
jgi:DNA-binding beta-propeller fold protein YncE